MITKILSNGKKILYSSCKQHAIPPSLIVVCGILGAGSASLIKTMSMKERLLGSDLNMTFKAQL